MKKLKDDKAAGNPYNPQFVAKIKKSRQEIAEGKGVRIEVGDLWKKNVR